jgi:hypothetical protein
VSDVFNIEVHGHHVYRITSDGILVHNNSAGSCPITGFDFNAKGSLNKGIDPTKNKLGRAALQARVDAAGAAKPITSGQNVAAALFDDGSIKTFVSDAPKKLHSEDSLLEYMINTGRRVVRLYSDRVPCANSHTNPVGGCWKLLETAAEFAGLKKLYAIRDNGHPQIEGLIDDAVRRFMGL